MITKTISFQNSEISYVIVGEGPSVMLIHGFGEDGSIWKNIASSLSAKYKFIIPDVPGSGKSQMITKDNPSIEDFAEVIKAIATNENEISLTIIGHSMGGYITLAYLEKYPADCKAIGLFHSTAYADDQLKIETRLKSIEFIKSNGSEAFLKTMIPGLFANKIVSQKHIDELTKIGFRINPETLIKYYHAMIARRDKTSMIKNMNIPLLLISGMYDNVLPVEHSLQQSHMPAVCDFHVLKNSAHEGMFEETNLSIEILAKFLQFL